MALRTCNPKIEFSSRSPHLRCLVPGGNAPVSVEGDIGDRGSRIWFDTCLATRGAIGTLACPDGLVAFARNRRLQSNRIKVFFGFQRGRVMLARCRV